MNMYLLCRWTMSSRGKGLSPWSIPRAFVLPFAVPLPSSPRHRTLVLSKCLLNEGMYALPSQVTVPSFSLTKQWASSVQGHWEPMLPRELERCDEVGMSRVTACQWGRKEQDT